MAPHLDEGEVLWVVAAIEPTTASAVAERLPVKIGATRKRLYRLQRGEYLKCDESTSPYVWRLTDAGREQLAALELPPPTEAAVAEYFSGYDLPDRLCPEKVGENLAALEATWHPTPAIVDQLPIGEHATRDHLNALVDEGVLEVDDTYRPYRWRLTDEGRRRFGGVEVEVDADHV